MVTLMSTNQPDDIFARHLLAAVGEVMLYWGYLESAMLEALDESSRGPSIFQRWLATAEPGEIVDQIKDAAAVRHLLAHGLCEIQARPPHGGEAEVLCRGNDGTLVRVTFGELQDTAQRLDRLRLRIGRERPR